VFYAQSVIADDVSFNEARVRARSLSSANLLFNILVTGGRSDPSDGLGFAPDLSDIRFNSGMLPAGPNQPFTEFTVEPHIPVAPGAPSSTSGPTSTANHPRGSAASSSARPG
jgi:hypothetical protein